MAPYTVVFPYVSTAVGGSYVSSSLLAGYLERNDDWLVRVSLPQRGLNASLFEDKGITTDYMVPGQESSAGARPKRLRYALLDYVKTYRLASSYLKQHGPDLLHVNNARTLHTWGLAAKRRGIPVVWHVRKESKERFDRYHLRLSDHLIFVSDATRRRFGEAALPPHTTIYNPVDFGIFYPSPQREAVRSKLGISPGQLTLGFVGNLSPRKRPEWAVASALELLKEGVDLQLIVVGQDYSQGGEYERRLRNMAEEAGFADRIKLLGYRDDVANVMRAMDVLLLASVEKGEGFPRAIIEAMASGVAVVATRVAGVPEAFRDDESGLMADPDSYNDFSSKVRTLAENADLRERLGRQALAEARARFSVEQCGQQVEAVYHTVLDARQRKNR